MSNLIKFAESELNSLLKTCTDSESLKTQKAINDDVLNMIKVFSDQNHSGLSANYALNLLTRLLKWLPISPLQGTDDEWTELNYSDDLCYQNKRCPSVFKDKEGRAYNTEGRVFSRNNGHTWYNSSESRVYIEFPYNVPNCPEYVIINNKAERENILSTILNIIELIENKDIDEATEDTNLLDILSLENINVLQDKLISVFNIEKPLFSLTNSNDIALWSVVDFVMDSDKKDDKE